MNFSPVPIPVPSMRAWHARSHGYSFVITQELETGDPEWSGFTASWKNEKADIVAFGKQPANRIDGGPWATFEEAETATNNVLKQLRNKQ